MRAPKHKPPTVHDRTAGESPIRSRGTTLGVAIAGTIVGSGAVFTDAVRGVWWLVLALGAGVLVLALVSTGRRATGTATRAAAVFDRIE